MQHSILNIAQELEGFQLVDSHLSFKGFIDFLKNRKLHEKTMKVKYLEFLVNHFELFGLRQVSANLIGREAPAQTFHAPVLYKLVRHPTYLGLIIAFWVAPTMTVGHLLFAAATTAYIFVGIVLEELDLIEVFGENYRSYRDRVSMLVPWNRPE